MRIKYSDGCTQVSKVNRTKLKIIVTPEWLMKLMLGKGSEQMTIVCNKFD